MSVSNSQRHDSEILDIRDLHFGYGRRTVLSGVNFSAKSGDLLCLLGENGAGKTTLFKLILGLLPCEKGEIRLNGDDLKQMRARPRARRLAYIPQIQRGNFRYTVEEMVLMGTTASLSYWEMPGSGAKKKAERAMAAIGIEDFAARYYDELSGGEQQLVLIARALAQETHVLLMDEPCASLDYGNQVRVLETVRNLARQGLLVLLSTHNPEQAMLFADQVLILNRGAIQAEGSPPEVMSAELLSELYRIPICVMERGDGGRSVTPDLLALRQQEAEARK